MIYYRILIGQTNKWSPQLAEGLINAIITDQELTTYAIEFQLVGTQQSIEFRLCFHSDLVQLATVISLVKAFYPESIVEEIKDKGFDCTSSKEMGDEKGLAKRYYSPV